MNELRVVDSWIAFHNGVVFPQFESVSDFYDDALRPKSRERAFSGPRTGRWTALAREPRPSTLSFKLLSLDSSTNCNVSTLFGWSHSRTHHNYIAFALIIKPTHISFFKFMISVASILVAAATIAPVLALPVTSGAHSKGLETEWILTPSRR